MAADLESIEAAINRVSNLPRPATSQVIVNEIELLMGDRSIDAIYRDLVIPDRTRSYEIGFVAFNPYIDVIYTLLGFELKISRRRLLCPDLATARYLSVFARLRCEKVAVPYDITRISRIADELESSWRRMSLLVDRLTAGRSARLKSNVLKALTEKAKLRIEESGSGARFPQFKAPRRRRSK
jgi:hypothetical protein